MKTFWHFFLIDKVNSKSEGVKGVSPEGIGVPKARKPLTTDGFLNYISTMEEMQNLECCFKNQIVKFSNAKKITFRLKQYNIIL